MADSFLNIYLFEREVGEGKREREADSALSEEQSDTGLHPTTLRS